MPIAPVYGRQRQQDSKFEANLGYIVRHSLKKKEKKKKKPTNKAGMVVHTSNPGAEAKAGASLGLPGWQPA